MKQVTGRWCIQQLIVVGLVILALTSCGGSSSGTRSVNPAPTKTAPALATAVAAPASPVPISGEATKDVAPMSPAVSPPPDQPFVSEQADLGPVQWTTMVNPTTLAPALTVETFATTASTIYAVVPVRRIAPGTVVSSSWSYNDAPINGVGASIAVPESLADVWLEFHLARTAVPAWPEGTYAIMIQINGQPALSSRVLVDEAASDGP